MPYETANSHFHLVFTGATPGREVLTYRVDHGYREPDGVCWVTFFDPLGESHTYYLREGETANLYMPNGRRTACFANREED